MNPPEELHHPVTAFLQHARRAPEEPWLFFRPELDWRWRSRRHLAIQLAAVLDVLRSREIPSPTSPRIAFPNAHLPEEAPDTVILDLAIQAVGGIAVPLVERTGSPEWEAALTTTRSTPLGVALPPPPSRFSTAPLPELAGLSMAGGVSLEGGEGIPSTRLAEAVKRVMAPLVGGADRDILVLGGGFHRWPQRALLIWATLMDAVVLLEPEVLAWGAAVRWARPTVVFGEVWEVERLAREARPPRGWQRRQQRPFAPPLDRLRAVVVHGEGTLSREAERRWENAGILVLTLPSEYPGSVV